MLSSLRHYFSVFRQTFNTGSACIFFPSCKFSAFSLLILRQIGKEKDTQRERTERNIMRLGRQDKERGRGEQKQMADCLLPLD